MAGVGGICYIAYSPPIFLPGDSRCSVVLMADIFLTIYRYVMFRFGLIQYKAFVSHIQCNVKKI